MSSTDDRFKLVTDFELRGDQPQAVRELTDGLRRGDACQVLLGVTGSGKTFTLAHVIAQVNRPALVMVHNKTLAAQLFLEFRRFFPDNAVEYFVSYYDYYQPEAYVPSTDSYIEKEATINDEIDRMRMSATRSLFERRDVIIVVTVAIVNLSIGRRTFKPTLLGKLATLVYLLTAAVTMYFNWLGRPSALVDVAIYATLGVTLVSGLHYIAHASRVLNDV